MIDPSNARAGLQVTAPGLGTLTLVAPVGPCAHTWGPPAEVEVEPGVFEPRHGQASGDPQGRWSALDTDGVARIVDLHLCDTAS